MKRFLSTLLAFVLAASFIPASALAEEAAKPENGAAPTLTTFGSAPSIQTEGDHVNPLYADLEISGPSAETAATDGAETLSVAEPLAFSGIAEASAYLADRMVERSSEIVVSFYDSRFNVANALFDELLQGAFEDDPDSAVAGDYLRTHYFGCHWSCTYNSGSKQYRYVISNIKYGTTAAQEQTVSREVESLIAQLGLNGQSEYEKVKRIHDWVVMNVSYDDYHVSDPSYLPQFTAYAALIDRTAVCQGFASLVYRLCKESGVQARYISGWGKNDSHGWNIVRIGSLWYNLDATWDQNIGNGAWTCYDFFLKSNAEFPDHVRDASYNTAEFNSAYPMSPTSYDPNVGPTTTSISGAQIAGLQQSYLYTGRPIEPAVTVTLDGKTLAQGVDYTLSYANTTYGTATVTATGIGAYRDSVQRTYSIVWTEACDLFVDTPYDAWYVEQGALAFVKDNGVMNGRPGGYFAPEDSITRADAATILYRLAGEPAVTDGMRFPDVDYGQYYGKPILWARENGIVNGRDDGTFDPFASITREEFAKIIGAYAETTARIPVISDCTAAQAINEWDLVSSWAQKYMGWAVDNKIINGVAIGSASYLQPQKTCTRAQAAKMLMVLEQDVIETYTPTEPAIFESDGYFGLLFIGTEGYEEGDYVDLDDPSALFEYRGPGAYVLAYEGDDSLVEIPATLEGQPVVYADVSYSTIRSLDASGCPTLRFLDCSSCGLTDLDVDGCSALEAIECGDNRLTALDVSDCLGLTEANLSYNDLRAIDVGSNRQLAYLDLDGNALSELDVRGLSELGMLSFQYNEISAIDVSDCTDLYFLGCRYNKLTSLSIDGLDKLMFLYCDHNAIADVSALETWASQPGHEGSITPQNV